MSSPLDDEPLVECFNENNEQAKYVVKTSEQMMSFGHSEQKRLKSLLEVFKKTSYKILRDSNIEDFEQ